MAAVGMCGREPVTPARRVAITAAGSRDSEFAFGGSGRCGVDEGERVTVENGAATGRRVVDPAVHRDPVGLPVEPALHHPAAQEQEGVGSAAPRSPPGRGRAAACRGTGARPSGQAVTQVPHSLQRSVRTAIWSRWSMTNGVGAVRRRATPPAHHQRRQLGAQRGRLVGHEGEVRADPDAEAADVSQSRQRLASRVASSAV